LEMEFLANQMCSQRPNDRAFSCEQRESSWRFVSFFTNDIPGSPIQIRRHYAVQIIQRDSSGCSPCSQSLGLGHSADSGGIES
jgi:hypothetical protein